MPLTAWFSTLLYYVSNVQDVSHDQGSLRRSTVVIVVDPMSPTPLYTQLADELAALIESGELLPERPLPSETRLRQEHGVSRGTVRAAMALMRERGLVITIPQRGTYVRKK
jgi:GntR family transcriptional regulator